MEVRLITEAVGASAEQLAHAIGADLSLPASTSSPPSRAATRNGVPGGRLRTCVLSDVQADARRLADPPVALTGPADLVVELVEACLSDAVSRVSGRLAAGTGG